MAILQDAIDIIEDQENRTALAVSAGILLREYRRMEKEREILWRKVDELERGNPSSVTAAPCHLPPGEGLEDFFIFSRERNTYYEFVFAGEEEEAAGYIREMADAELFDPGDYLDDLMIIRGREMVPEIQVEVQIREREEMP